MASVINTNMASLVTQKNLSRSQETLSTSVARLSSGLRINSAKDDAAGLAISQVLQSQVKGINQSIRNANDAISMAQTAEGALNQVSEMLQRVKELATQGSNEALSQDQFNSIGSEVKSLLEEIGSIRDRTTFNGSSIFSAGNKNFQTGNATTDLTTVVLSEIKLDKADDGDTTSIDEATATIKKGVTMDAGNANVANFKLLTTAVESDIKTVATARGKMGEIQNRLDNAIFNLQSQSENLSAARSRVVDTDYASETANLTKGQIMQQAGAAMLAQANQMPNVILSLLK